MKKCHSCKISKNKSEFGKHNQKKDGLDPNCKACRNARAKKYYRDNAEKIKAARQEYYENNKRIILDKQNVYKRKRRKQDEFVLLQRRLRNRLYYALKRTYWKKNTHFSEYIGCTKKELINHIESQFVEGMNWNNRELWHIDHIIPLSSAKTKEELYKLCHYTNLQPLWASDNIKKGNHIA